MDKKYVLDQPDSGLTWVSPWGMLPLLWDAGSLRGLGSLRLVAKIEGLRAHQTLGIPKRSAGGCRLLLSGVESAGTQNCSVVTRSTPKVTGGGHGGGCHMMHGGVQRPCTGTMLSQQGTCLTRTGHRGA